MTQTTAILVEAPDAPPQARRAPGWATIALVALLVLWLAEGIRWILAYRQGQPLDVDEAGYLRFAMRDHLGLFDGGLSGWRDAAVGQAVYAPGLPALTALWFVVTGPGVGSSVVLVLLLSTVTLATSYWLGRTVGSAGFALLVTLTVAATPIFINYSRSFHFSVPATAAAAFALLSLAKSNRMHSVSWSVAFGASVGVMLLFRTMVIGFVPGLVLAAVVQASATRESVRRRWLNLALSVAAAVAVAATWYVTNYASVLDYLTAFGFGNRAAEYGGQTHFYLPEAWLAQAKWTTSNDLHLPLAVMLSLGVVGAAVAVVRRARSVGVRRTTGVIVRSRLFPSAVYVAGGLFVLTSTANKGSAFFLPLVPAASLLGVWGLVRLVPRIRWLAPAMVVAVALLSFVPSLVPGTRLANDHEVKLPLLGFVTVTDGAGTIQLYERAGGYGWERSSAPIDAATGEAWRAASVRAAEEINRLGGGTLAKPAFGVFGFRDRLFSINSVGLESDLGDMPPLTLGMVPIPDLLTDGGYASWLQTGDGRDACVLITATPGTGEFEPIVPADQVVQAARDSGFEAVDSWPLPNGRTVQFWRRASTCPST